MTIQVHVCMFVCIQAYPIHFLFIDLSQRALRLSDVFEQFYFLRLSTSFSFAANSFNFLSEITKTNIQVFLGFRATSRLLKFYGWIFWWKISWISCLMHVYSRDFGVFLFLLMLTRNKVQLTFLSVSKRIMI